MSAATEVPGKPAETEVTDRGREAIALAAAGEKLTARQELDGLDWLLGNPPPVQHKVPVTLETEQGPATLTFVIRASDGRKIDAAEQEQINPNTGRIDQMAADLAIVHLATVYIEGLAGNRTKLSDQRFRTVPMRKGDATEMVELASPVEALEARFRSQLGLIAGVAREIRRISGWDPSLVGKAQRMLVDAAGN